MMRVNLIVALFLLFNSVSAHAQWAVYDDEVKKVLLRINNVKNLNGMGSGKTYDSFESERTESGDIKMGSSDNAATFKSLDTAFEDSTKLPELTDEQKVKYIGTEADCGQKETAPAHWSACMGLRNLRLQTIVQSHAMLKNISRRREQIASLIKMTRDFPQTEGTRELGQIQRAQFEIQGQQALMQADSFSLQVLMDGYRQREQVYMLQQAEARKSMLSQAKMGKSAKAPPFVPFIRAAPSNN